MKRIYIPFLLCLLSVSATFAQQKKYKGTMSINPLQLEQKGDSLYINVDFDITGMNVASRRSISLIPILATANQKKELPAVEVKGRANYLTSKRAVALMSKAERQLYNQKPPYAIVKGYNKESKRIQYQQTIPFEAWMKEAQMDIQQDLCGCGNAPKSLMVSRLVNRIQLEKIITPYTIIPYLAYVQPEAEAIKSREMVGESFLDFVVGKTDIRPDYMNNPQELKKITDMMSTVRNDPSITVKGISVEGYASPEGSLAGNERLSEGRASALVEYLLPRFDYPKQMYRVVFGGENWDGLLKTVTGSDMAHKEQVLAILNNKGITDEVRKTKLKLLFGGEPYRYMVKEFYPSLRKAVCKIDYQIKGFDVAEAKEVFKTRPQNLSLNEMFLVANTYEAGTQEFIDIFETAVRMFPDNKTAMLNAASAALSRNDLVSAQRYLGKLNGKLSSAEYYNALGVLEMLKGEYNEAREHLQSAANAGLNAAKLNIDELNKKIENIEQIAKKNKKYADVS